MKYLSEGNVNVKKLTKNLGSNKTAKMRIKIKADKILTSSM